VRLLHHFGIQLGWPINQFFGVVLELRLFADEAQDVIGHVFVGTDRRGTSFPVNPFR